MKTTLILLAAAVVALAGCAKKEPAKAADAPLTVNVARVEVRNLASSLSASGALISREEAAVAPELSGYRVAQVFADEGDFVRRGQPLARLDDTLLRSQIDQARAGLVQQQVAAERAEAEAERVRGLDNQGVLSQEAIEERRLTARSARAAVGVAQAQLRDLQVRQGRMSVNAPVAGRILERTVRPGDSSSPGSNMFRIARDGLVELDAEVTEADLSKLRPGARASVTLPDGAEVVGVVRLVSPRVDPQSRLGHVRLSLPARADLRPGGYARAAFQPSDRGVPAVPEAAIRYDADGASVMVVQPDNRARRAAVRTGGRAGGWVELVQGPPAGSRVALGGSAFILDGDLVRPVEAGPPTAPAPAQTGAAR